MDTERTKSSLETILGRSIDRIKPTGGEGSYPSFFIYCSEEAYFVKTKDRESLVFETESHGLEELSKYGALTPTVIYHDQSYLILKALSSHPRTDEFWKNLAKSLAKIHKQRGPHFGYKEDNFIGLAPQVNKPDDSWASFFWNNRILYKLNEITKHRDWSLESEKLQKLESVSLKLLQTCNGHPSPLHGDLWNGNILCGSEQSAYFIDPAFYYGDRETDIAMTECFGGFAQVFYQTYEQAYPLDEGYKNRKHLYNLYHILNHFLIFGDQYRNSVENLIEMIISTENA